MAISKKRVLKLIGESNKPELEEKQQEKQKEVVYELSESLIEEIKKLEEKDKKDDEECDNPGEKKKSKGKGKGLAKGKGKGPIGKPSGVEEEYLRVVHELELNEQEKDVDVTKIIKELAETDYKDDNKLQGKMVQLMKGLAFSDNKEATTFMNKVSDALTKIAKDMGIK